VTRFGLAMAMVCLATTAYEGGAGSLPNISPQPVQDGAPNPVERRGFAWGSRHMNARDLVAMRKKNARKRRR